MVGFPFVDPAPETTKGCQLIALINLQFITRMDQVKRTGSHPPSFLQRCTKTGFRPVPAFAPRYYVGDQHFEMRDGGPISRLRPRGESPRRGSDGRGDVPCLLLRELDKGVNTCLYGAR